MTEYPVELSNELKEIVHGFEDDLSKGSNQNEREYKAIMGAIDKLKINPECGNHIKAKNVNEKLVNDYGVNKNNVWRLDISSDWRLVYTISGTNEVKIFSLILKVFFSHKDYEKCVYRG